MGGGGGRAGSGEPGAGRGESEVCRIFWKWCEVVRMCFWSPTTKQLNFLIGYAFFLAQVAAPRRNQWPEYGLGMPVKARQSRRVAC